MCLDEVYPLFLIKYPPIDYTGRKVSRNRFRCTTCVTCDPCGTMTETYQKGQLHPLIYCMHLQYTAGISQSFYCLFLITSSQYLLVEWVKFEARWTCLLAYHLTPEFKSMAPSKDPRPSFFNSFCVQLTRSHSVRSEGTYSPYFLFFSSKEFNEIEIIIKHHCVTFLLWKVVNSLMTISPPQYPVFHTALQCLGLVHLQVQNHILYLVCHF